MSLSNYKEWERHDREGERKQYITLLFNCQMQELAYKEGISHEIL